MTKGLTSKETLKKLSAEDSDRELRQVAVMDFNGRKAAFTGAKAPKFCGEITAENYVVIGNLLAGKQVVSSMAREFNNSGDKLAWRLARALKAGSESGGDRRGEKSAVLIVVGTEGVEVEIRIDKHAKPIRELLRRLS